MKTIKLYGHLRKAFGPEYRMDVESPAEAVRALCAMVPGFRAHLEKHKNKQFQVILGGSQEGIGEKELSSATGERVIKIVPVVAGAKGALGQILAGAVLLVAGYLTGGTALAFLQPMLYGAGASMVMGGVAQMISKQPTLTPPDSQRGLEERPFYSFNGPHMTTGQGNPVPVLLGGPLRIGGALVSMGISTEQWTVKGLGGKAPDDAGTRGGNGDTEPWVWAVGPA